eukprot:PhF_6_TR13010/c0_g1_i1/m.20616
MSIQTGTKSKMNVFLDSFDENITIHTDLQDETHKSIHHTMKAGPNINNESNNMCSQFSLKRLQDLSPQARSIYDEYRSNGFAFIPNFVEKKDVPLVQHDLSKILEKAAFGENSFYGGKTKRAYSVLAHTRSLDSALIGPIFHEMLDAYFAPNPLINALQLIEIFPGEKAQKLHYDQQFGNHGNRTRSIEEDDGINFIIAVDDFTEENGATIVLPGSHLWPRERTPQPGDKTMKLIMPAGTACMFSGNLWHGGGANTTNRTRKALILVINQPWFRTLENHFLSIPFATAASLHVKIQSLLGYSLHHPFIGQVDFGHPRKKLMEIVEREKLEKQNRSKL